MNIVFDLDGTLLDVSHRHHHVYTLLVKQFDGQPLELKKYWQLKRNKTSWPDILAASGVSPKFKESILAKFTNLIEQPKFLNIDNLFPFTIKVLEQLKDNELYLISLRRHDDRLRQQVKKLGIEKYFVKIASGHAESDSQGYKAKLIKNLIGDSEALVAGDTEADVLAAKILGLKSVAVLSGIRTKAILDGHEPDYLVDDVRALPSLIQT